MSQLEKEASGSTPESSASGQNNVDGANSTESSASDDAAKKHIEKLLTEKKNAMKGNADLKSQLDEALQKLKSIDEEKMIANDEHVKVIGLQRDEISKLKGELSNIEQMKVVGKKNLAMFSELDKLGFVNSEVNKDIVMKLFDASSIEIDPTTGIAIGADSAAQKFHEKYNSLGVFGKKAVGTSHQAANLNGNQTANKSVSNMTRQEQQDKMKAALSNIIK